MSIEREHGGRSVARRMIAKLAVVIGLVVGGAIAPDPVAFAADPAEGDYVVATDNGEIYRIVGGAPLHISSWGAVGGPHASIEQTRAQIDALAQYPADGTFVRAGTRVYRFAGGAPLYVSTWDAFGGEQTTLGIDNAALDQAGNTASPWNHVRLHPADGSFITTTDAIYRFAGGAPIAVSSGDVFGGEDDSATLVDAAAITNAGTGGRYRFVRALPLDATFITTHEGTVFRIAGGAPLHVSDWDAVGGEQTSVIVDAAAVERAGEPGRWSHLNVRPAEGTVLRAGVSGSYHRVSAAGAPLPSAPSNSAVVVDPAAIVNAGDPAPWDHLAAPPPWLLTIAKAGSGNGIVTSASGGLSCGATCVSTFDHGSAVTLTAAPGAGSAFAGWSGGGCSGTSTCVTTVISAQIVTATFTSQVASLGPTGEGFTPLTPTRIFDTRQGEPHGTITVTKQPIGGPTELRLKITGTSGVPTTGVSAISLNLTATGSDTEGFITTYPCGTRPLASNLNYRPATTTANAVIAPISTTGEICIYANTNTNVIADINGWFPTGGQLTALTPTRIFDTRQGEPHGTITVTKQPIGGPTELRLKITGTSGVPTTGVSAISLNLTATGSDTEGFITTYPCGTRPLASNLNYRPATTTANAVIAPISTTGEICIYANTNTNVIADINGWFPTGGQLTALTPTRIFDTRQGEPHGTITVTKQPIGGPTELRLKITGTSGVPTTGVSAISLNLTATGSDTEGFITTYPCGTRPLASNLNYRPATTTANAVIAPISTTGEICIYANTNTNVIADINGWFAAGTS